MQIYLLDTNHASARWLGQRRMKFFPPGNPVTLCYPGVAELWYMVHNSGQRVQNELSLRYFLSSFQIWDFDARAAEEYGIIRTELRKAGRPIQSIDIQIAAIARANNLTVLTADQHFSFIPGLKYENWIL